MPSQKEEELIGRVKRTMVEICVLEQGGDRAAAEVTAERTYQLMRRRGPVLLAKPRRGKYHVMCMSVVSRCRPMPWRTTAPATIWFSTKQHGVQDMRGRRFDNQDRQQIRRLAKASAAH